MPLAPGFASQRARGGWWGVTFAVGLLIVGGMVSLPTAARNGTDIAAFYSGHRSLIIAQQVVSVLILGPWLWFAGALDRRARVRGNGAFAPILFTAWLVVAAELATNVPPLILAAMADPAPATAHSLTVAEDLADVALFVAIALFAMAIAPTERSWVRAVGFGVAALTLARAVASPLGVTSLDVAAPFAFLALVVLLSVRLLRDRTALRELGPDNGG